jgi:hypothetical protein
MMWDGSHWWRGCNLIVITNFSAQGAAQGPHQQLVKTRPPLTRFTRLGVLGAMYVRWHSQVAQQQGGMYWSSSLKSNGQQTGTGVQLMLVQDRDQQQLPPQHMHLWRALTRCHPGSCRAHSAGAPATCMTSYPRMCHTAAADRGVAAGAAAGAAQ